LIILAALTLVIAKYAEVFYRWDLNIVYGRQFNKLEELLNDMEELRR
jgi:hypothetical protein